MTHSGPDTEVSNPLKLLAEELEILSGGQVGKKHQLAATLQRPVYLISSAHRDLSLQQQFRRQHGLTAELHRFS